MEQVICDYVKSRLEPDFFHDPDDQALQQAHEAVKQGIENATETMSIEMDYRLIKRAEKALGAIGWTLEEALILFIYWSISCPEQLAAWAKKHGIEDEVSIANSGAIALQKNVIGVYTETCANAMAETDEESV